VSAPSPRSLKARRRAARARRERSGRARGRFAVLWVLTFVGFASLVFRAASLQIAPSPKLQEANEEARQERLAEVTLPADRGSIFDRNGVELAISVPETTIIADARSVADPAGVANLLAPILQKDPADLTKVLSSGLGFVYLARQVDDATAAQVEQLRAAQKWEFITTKEEAKRFNPSGNELALSLLGRTDIDGNGVSGLEKQYQDTLKGTDGEVVSERGTRNRTIPGGQQEVTAATPGTSLVLSIDRGLQYEVEKILKRVVDEQQAKGGTVIITNDRTGEILANANVVRDDGAPAKESVDNRAVTWTFEPGSINKTLTLSGVLNDGLATPDQPRLISAKIDSYEMEFTDEGRSADQIMTPTEILRVSSNNGTVTWAQDLGKQRLHDYFDSFGLGKKTSLQFPGESAGTLLPLKKMDDVSFRTMSYGLGLSATPMQMLSAYNTIANNGVSVPVRYVLGKQSAGGVFEAEPVVAGTRVVTDATAAGMTQMLSTVVGDGTGKNAQVAGYTVAGKTGTAWKALDGGGYGYPGNRKLVTSFVGFLPNADPGLSMIVVIDEPANQNASGGAVAAPVFSEIASFAVRQLRIAPDADAATPTSNKERVRSQPQSVVTVPPPVLGPPAPASTTTTTMPKATTTTAPKATTTTTSAPKATTTTTTAPKTTTTTAPRVPPVGAP
jgi:cell division protein FtsI (penicillin-binding protein 3)